MCSCHSIPECCVMFSGVKLSMGSFVLFQAESKNISIATGFQDLVLENVLLRVSPEM